MGIIKQKRRNKVPPLSVTSCGCDDASYDYAPFGHASFGDASDVGAFAVDASFVAETFAVDDTYVGCASSDGCQNIWSGQQIHEVLKV